MTMDRDPAAPRLFATGVIRVVAVAAVAMLVGTCSRPPDVLAQVRALGVLKVATRNSPTAYYLGIQGPEGPEYELAAAFARRLGVRLQLVVVPSPAAAIDAVRRNRAQIAAAGLKITHKARGIVFGPAYQRIDLHVVYREDRPRPAGLSTVAPRAIAVPAGSAHAEALAGARASHPTLHWRAIPGADPLDLLARVARGDAELTVADSNEFALGRHYHPSLRVAFDLEGTRSLAWALADDEPQLAAAVRDFFSTARADGSLTALLGRYDAAMRRFDAVDSTAFLQHVAERLPALRAYFEEAAAQIGGDWRLLAAIGYQESRWNPQAQSPTGVRGLMMLTADAAARVGVTDRDDARQSILGGARYLMVVRNKVPARIAEPDRTWFALAAYNTGFGHLEDARILAQRLGRKRDSWNDVRATLPLLAEERYYLEAKRGYARGWEPVRFVDNIRSYLRLLEWMTGSPDGPLVPAVPPSPDAG
jgi:membrane-bound lytic murein transglycosylase F